MVDFSFDTRRVRDGACSSVLLEVYMVGAYFFCPLWNSIASVICICGSLIVMMEISLSALCT